MALFSPELDVKFLVKIMDKLHRESIHFGTSTYNSYMHGSFIGTSSSRTSLIDQKEYSYMLKMIKRRKRQGIKIIIHANRSINTFLYVLSGSLPWSSSSLPT